MEPQALREHLRRRPFQPFRVMVSDGNEYDVVSHECMLVTKTTTAINIPGLLPDSDMLRMIDTSRIEKVVPITDNMAESA
jgi:hypothetical protein